MAELPHTLIIGDKVGGALYDALFTIPGTGAIWQDIWTGAGISPDFWASETKKALEEIAKGANGKAPDKLPDTVLVSLGRQEIVAEPDSATAQDFATLADNTGKFIDAMRGLGLKVAWVLPPGMKHEGKARATIAAAAVAKGVRVFHAEHSFSDPIARGTSAGWLQDVSKDTVGRMADLIATWLPLGGPRGPIVQRSGQASTEEPTGGGLVTGFFSGGAISGMSTGGKVALVGGAALLLGGAVYYGYRRRG